MTRQLSGENITKEEQRQIHTARSICCAIWMLRIYRKSEHPIHEVLKHELAHFMKTARIINSSQNSLKKVKCLPNGCSVMGLTTYRMRRIRLLTAGKRAVWNDRYQTREKRFMRILCRKHCLARMKNGRLNLFSKITAGKGNHGLISIELNPVKDINSRYNKYNLVVSVFPSQDNYARNVIKTTEQK